MEEYVRRSKRNACVFILLFTSTFFQLARLAAANSSTQTDGEPLACCCSQQQFLLSCTNNIISLANPQMRLEVPRRCRRTESCSRMPSSACKDGICFLLHLEGPFKYIYHAYMHACMRYISYMHASLHVIYIMHSCLHAWMPAWDMYDACMIACMYACMRYVSYMHACMLA